MNGKAHVLNARVIESPVDAIELGYPTCATSAAAAGASATASTATSRSRPFLIRPSSVVGHDLLQPLLQRQPLLERRGRDEADRRNPVDEPIGVEWLDEAEAPFVEGLEQITFSQRLSPESAARPARTARREEGRDQVGQVALKWSFLVAAVPHQRDAALRP